MTTAPETFTPTEADVEALQRAIDMTLAEPDPGRVLQMQRMLEEDDWFEAARFAAYHQQTKNLRLRPWQSPPCCVGARAGTDEEILEIGRRLVRLGLSLFEPDPLKAIENAKLSLPGTIKKRDL
jgi:hypothetical protein